MAEEAGEGEGSYQACYGCGLANGQGLRMRFAHLPDGSAECVYTAADHLAGAPGVIHGGVQATLLDEVMGHAIHGTGTGLDPDLDVVTVDFSLSYRRPAPVAVPLTVRARLVRTEGRDFFVTGEIVSAGGQVLTTAESRWRRVNRPPR